MLSRRDLLKAAGLAIPALAAASLPTKVFAETLNGTEITALPAVITQSGLYVLRQNLQSSGTNPAAIVVAANNVTIDFNGYSITNVTSGVSNSIGVLAIDREDVTIRGGKLSNFFAGVVLERDTLTSGGHLVENMEIVLPSGFGILVSGEGSVVRDNRILGAGGPSSTTCQGVVGIAVHCTLGANVTENQVVMSPAVPGTQTIGIMTSGESSRVLVVKNRVVNPGIGVVFASNDQTYLAGKYHGNSVIAPTAWAYLGGTNGMLNGSAS